MKMLQSLTLIPTLVLTLSGCALQRPAPIAQEEIPVQVFSSGTDVRAPMSPVVITRALAQVEDQDLIVSGWVKRLYEVSLPGHIDIAVFAPDGTLLAKEKALVPGLNSNRRGVMQTRFQVQLPQIPPADAKILLHYHAPGASNPKWSCEKS